MQQGDVHLTAELLERVGEKARVRFSVKDTSIGMTPEQAARLFQPFSQAGPSTTRRHGGTGLGLTIGRRLVELMGGEIWLESEPAPEARFCVPCRWASDGQATGGRRTVKSLTSTSPATKPPMCAMYATPPSLVCAMEPT